MLGLRRHIKRNGSATARRMAGRIPGETWEALQGVINDMGLPGPLASELEGLRDEYLENKRRTAKEAR